MGKRETARRVSKRLSIASLASVSTRLTSRSPPELCKFNGISVASLEGLREALVSKRAAPNVVLYTLKESCNGVPSGTTLRWSSNHSSNSKMVGVSPLFKGVEVTFSESKAKLKRREDWTTEDVCHHIVLPMLLRRPSKNGVSMSSSSNATYAEATNLAMGEPRERMRDWEKKAEENER